MPLTNKTALKIQDSFTLRDRFNMECQFQQLLSSLFKARITPNEITSVAKNQDLQAIRIIGLYFQVILEYKLLALELDTIAALKAWLKIQDMLKNNTKAAVEQCIHNLTTPHQDNSPNCRYLLILIALLRSKSLHYLANLALNEYHKIINQLKEGHENIFCQERLHSAHVAVNHRVDELINKLTGKLTHTEARSLLEELGPILKINNRKKGRLIAKIQETCNLIQGKSYTQLAEHSKAWLAYSAVTKRHQEYRKAISSLAELLKIKVDILCNFMLDGILDVKIRTTVLASIDYLYLQTGEHLSLTFKQHWQADTKWFHSFNQTKYLKSYRRLKTQLQKQYDEQVEILPQTTMLLEVITHLGMKYSLNERQNYWRHSAERMFFSLRHANLEKITTLATKIIDQRYRTQDPENIDLTDCSARLLIRTERMIQEATIDLNTNTALLGIPISQVCTRKTDAGFIKNHSFGPTENYTVSNTRIAVMHKCMPKLEKLGTSYMPAIKSYSTDVVPFFNKLLTDDQNNRSANEQALATLMIKYGRRYGSVTLDDLQQINSNENEKDLDQFNRICFFILGKEQAKWQSAKNERYHLGMTVSLARSLIMIEAGYIPFNDTFENSAFFSVYSHRSILNGGYQKLVASCQHIDRLYLIYLMSKNVSDQLTFFKKEARSKHALACALTRKQAHSDLKYVYGSDTDSDDEGYESDSLDTEDSSSFFDTEDSSSFFGTEDSSSSSSDDNDLDEKVASSSTAHGW
jgi:hypothetical protein